MKKIFLLFVAVACMLAVQAQKSINDPNAEVRNVSGFHAIKVSNAIDVYLSQGSTEGVAVSALEPKYRDRIKTSVENGVLKIWFDNEGNWKLWGNAGSKKLKAYISFKTLDKLAASGACDVMVEGIIKSTALDITLSGASDFKGQVDAGTLNIEQTGASDATITGRAGSLKINAGGASNFKGYDLETENCQAQASGASDIKITVSKELNARASGASSIRYKGAAVIRDLHTSGASNVSKKS